MKRLFLMRHGEASFSADVDFDRTLTPKGKSKVSHVAARLYELAPEIGKVYCSPAKRTKETASIIAERVLIKSQEYVRSIYDGDLQDLMDILENSPQDVNEVMIVGHNPLISLFAANLSDGDYLNMQPGDLIYIEFPLESWQLITFGSGILCEVIS
ncbi:phosphohistidine phosphatase SixA [Algoriphagus kandeliae]|uniref:Phosphohistidine phosphatase SixA n=1 Tax=Algoriphagus kandeliae TaxID=2562278 RepID=A0A4Y9QSW6_9BACT|nr:phosphohistidine phosphatase SixA [Algoriphagus kandeliae]TFV94223.1 phosphohistidine phosphatase SixA [Algoriphagus kandeliae]